MDDGVGDNYNDEVILRNENRCCGNFIKLWVIRGNKMSADGRNALSLANDSMSVNSIREM